MPSDRRLSPAPPVVFALAMALTVSLVPPAAAKKTFPIDVAVQSETRAQLAGAAVSIRAESGAPFAVEGLTDERGHFATKLPNFSRVYEIRVRLEGFVEFVQSLDLAAQNLQPRATAEITVTLPEKRGPAPEEIFNDGVRALQANDSATAEAKMKRALELAPDLAPAWSVLAMLYADTRRWPEALEAADKTLALKPDDLAALRARPEALAGLGRQEEAGAALDALAGADHSKESARLLFNAGAEAWRVKDAALGTKRFEQALAADPGLHQACAALAEVKIGTKDLPGALADLERGLVIAPTEKKLWRRKIDVLRALGRAEEAATAEKTLAELGG